MHSLLIHWPYRQSELAVHLDPRPPFDVSAALRHLAFESPDTPSEISEIRGVRGRESKGLGALKEIVNGDQE